MELTIRNTDLQTLGDMLAEQHVAKVDVVLPATALTAVDGQIRVAGVETIMDETGITDPNQTYRLTDGMVGDLSSKLGIPLPYLRKMHAERADLFDYNINGWLHGQRADMLTDNPDVPGGLHHAEIYPADPRNFLFRSFISESGNVARALLSDKYKRIDNIDVLFAALEGIQATGLDIAVSGADLSETRMNVRLTAPGMTFGVRQLVEGYRSPFAAEEHRIGRGGWDVPGGLAAATREGQAFEPGKEPVAFAGFVISNSEVGGGSFSITPRATIQVCRNGLVVTEDIDRTRHFGMRQEEGVVRWSDETKEKELALIKAQTADIVKTFLSADYWNDKVASLAKKAAAPVEDPAKTIEVVAKSLRYTEDQQKTILRHFILGGQMTAGGVMNAVTSAAQTVADADVAAAMEADAVKVLSLV